MTERDQLARVALSRLTRPGRRDLGALVDTVGAAEALDRVVSGDVAAALRRATSRQLVRLGGDPWLPAEGLIQAGRAAGARLVVPGDDEWPPHLAELGALSSDEERHTYPPLCLWVRGAAPARDALDRAVAVVGTQAASPYGLRVARELASALTAHGWTVVSCTSAGINAAVHRGAIAAAAADGCASIGVLPGGIDVPYPRADAALVDTIAEHGLLVSERPPGTAVWPYRFSVRDRLIAMLARGVVVVEAELRSSARRTADWARRLGRVVMAVPGPVTSDGSAGPHAEIAHGVARLVTSADDVLDQLGRGRRPPATQTRSGIAVAPARASGAGSAPAAGSDVPPIPGRGAAAESDAAPAAGGDVPPSAGPGGANAGDVDLDSAQRRVLAAVPQDKPVHLAIIAMEAGLSPVELRRALPDLVARGLVEQHPDGYRYGPRSAAGTTATPS